MTSISEFLGLELENEDLRKEITDLKEANRVLRLKTAALEDKAEQSETYHVAYTRQTLSLEKANTYIRTREARVKELEREVEKLVDEAEWLDEDRERLQDKLDEQHSERALATRIAKEHLEKVTELKHRITMLNKAAEDYKAQQDKKLDFYKTAIKVLQADIKQLSQTTDKINFNLYEILDRAHSIQCYFWDLFDEHEALEQCPELEEKTSKVKEAMMNLYQLAGAEWNKHLNQLRKSNKAEPEEE